MGDQLEDIVDEARAASEGVQPPEAGDGAAAGADGSVAGADGEALEDPIDGEAARRMAEELKRENAEFIRQTEERATDLESDAEALHEASRQRMAEAVELSGTRNRLVRERDAVLEQRQAASDAARAELQKAQEILRQVDELHVAAEKATERGDLRAAEEAREDAEAKEVIARAHTQRSERTQKEADDLSDEADALRDAVAEAAQAFEDARAEVVEWDEAADQMDDKAAKLREVVEHRERALSLQEELDDLSAKIGTDGWSADEFDRVTDRIGEAVQAEKAAQAAADEIRIDPAVAESDVLGPHDADDSKGPVDDPLGEDDSSLIAPSIDGLPIDGPSVDVPPVDDALPVEDADDGGGSGLEPEGVEVDADPVLLVPDPLEEPVDELAPTPTAIKIEPPEIPVAEPAEPELDTFEPEPALEPDDALVPSDDLPG